MFVSVVCLHTLAGAMTVVRAQEPQPSALQRYWKYVPQPDQGGGFHFLKHLAVVFGGIKPGQSIALGPAVSTTFRDGGYAQLKGEYSIRKFSLVQGRYDTRPFWHRHGLLITRARWQDAPELDLYGLGRDSPHVRARYGERRSELSTALDIQPLRWVHLTASAGVERYEITAVNGEVAANGALEGVPLEPGLSTRPWFAHLSAGAALDTRASGYARSGTLLDASVGEYRDRHDGSNSFQRLEVGGRQFVAVGSRGSLGVSARAWLSYAATGRAVPFFLMPTLGGGDALEGFNLYRFRDRNALWAKAEYRHALHEMIDAVGFYETGSVAPTARALTFAGAARDEGAGVIFHTKDAPVLRFDVAHSREGFGVAILFTAGGKS